MLDVFFVTFPFFFLVFAGYFAVSKGLLTVSAVPGLNSFVLYFALPCMCFRFGSETSVAEYDWIQSYSAFIWQAHSSPFSFALLSPSGDRLDGVMLLLEH